MRLFCHFHFLMRNFFHLMRDFLFVYLPFCLHSSCASDALGPFRPLSTLLRTGLDFESRCPRAPEGHAEPARARPGVPVLAALSCHGDGSSRPDVAPGVAGFRARLLAVGLSPPRQHAGPAFRLVFTEPRKPVALCPAHRRVSVSSLLRALFPLRLLFTRSFN